MRPRVLSVLAVLIVAGAMLGVGRASDRAGAGAQATPAAGTPSTAASFEQRLDAVRGAGVNRAMTDVLTRASTTVQTDEDGPRTAAIHAGSCDDLDSDPVFELDEVTAGETAATEPATPVETSFSSVDAPLADLLAEAHAIVVAIDGDPEAAVACGELGDEGEDNLFVGLREQNRSGSSGVAWLRDEGDATRVSLFLAEGLADTGGATPDDGPPPPPDDDNGPPPPPDDEPTPPDDGPTPPDDEPTPDPDGQDSPPAEGRTYTSPNHGFSLTYDPATWQVVSGPSSEEGADYVGLASTLSFVDFLGVPINGEVDAQQCLTNLANYTRNREDVTAFEPAADETGAPLQGGDATDAFAAYNVTFVNEEGLPIEVTLRDRCVVLVPGQSLLISEHFAPSQFFEDEEAAREELYAGLELP